MSISDENAAILSGIEADGGNLGSPRRVDFAHVFPERRAAAGFAKAATRDGFHVGIEEVDRENRRWDVIASKTMIPSAENITSVEERLGGMAQEHGGIPDGWGFERI
ncbi:ribonuclease E inhibitor RraB [Sphingomonas sp. NPDC079357]|uniref:ribonuclease E inhibitor RraB n=1 Tax=Sphingomonas sp. NPDC079357 TaxID=3364518 RepID=UPI00384BA335